MIIAEKTLAVRMDLSAAKFESETRNIYLAMHRSVASGHKPSHSQISFF